MTVVAEIITAINCTYSYLHLNVHISSNYLDSLSKLRLHSTSITVSHRRVSRRLWHYFIIKGTGKTNFDLHAIYNEYDLHSSAVRR